MKANKYYPSCESLEIFEIDVKNTSCCDFRVTFSIDCRHILLAIAEILTHNEIQEIQETITVKRVKDHLRRELFYNGESWYCGAIDYGETSNFSSDIKEKIIEALPIGKKLFPSFFDIPNSVKFIKDLA